MVAVEQLGGLSYVRLAQHDMVLQVPGQTGLRPGEAVGLRLPPEHVHLFDKNDINLPAPAVVVAA